MTALTITRDIIVSAMVITGFIFLLVGTVGLLRLPNAYTRLHPSTICDTMGGGLIILAMIIYGGLSSNILQLLFIAFLLFLSSAVNGHAIGRAIYKEQTRQNTSIKMGKDRKADEEIPVA